MALPCGAIGILCPFLLFNYYEHSAKAVPLYIFSIYCLIFGVLLMIVEFRISVIVNLFLFVTSYYHRAFFIMFSGTLAMCAYNPMKKFEWAGYLLGGFIIGIGVLHIAVGCSNDAWVKEQNSKYMPKVDPRYLQNPAQAQWVEAGVGGGVSSGTSVGVNPQPPNQTLDTFYATQPVPAQVAPAQYPSLSTDSSIISAQNKPSVSTQPENRFDSTDAAQHTPNTSPPLASASDSTALPLTSAQQSAVAAAYDNLFDNSDSGGRDMGAYDSLFDNSE